MVSALTGIIGPAQAWSLLRRHAEDDVAHLRLVDLRGGGGGGGVDDDGFVAVHRSSSAGAVVGGGNNDNGKSDHRDDNDDDGGGGGHLLIADWSRQRMTSDTSAHLLRLSASMGVRERILDLAWGRLAGGRTEGAGGGGRDADADDDDDDDDDDDGDDSYRSPTVSFAGDPGGRPGGGVVGGGGGAMDGRRKGGCVGGGDDDCEESDERRGSMHLALRMPAGRGMFVLDPPRPASSDDAPSGAERNALDDVHSTWRRVRRLSGSIRRGRNTRGASGRPLCDVLVLSSAGAGGGGGVVPRMLEFVYRALDHDGAGRYASMVDPSVGSVVGCPSSPSSSSTGAGVGGEQPTMASTLQAAAGGGS